jgi:MFS family permease
VKNSTPTQAGMQMLPMMAGLLVASIATGRLISKIGKYRLFPIIGMALTGLAMLLFARLGIDTSMHWVYGCMALLGLGLGMVMQVLILAAQNAVSFQHLGVATSSVTMFRSIGGSIGVAAFGAIFANGLQSRLAALLGEDFVLPRTLGPSTIHALPTAVHDHYLNAFAGSLHLVYALAAGVAVLAFVLAWGLKDLPLRGRALGTGA